MVKKVAWLLVVLLAASVGWAQQTNNQTSAGQDVKNAGRDAEHATEKGAKATGHATKQGAKKVGHVAKGGVHKGAKETEKGAGKVEDKTKP